MHRLDEGEVAPFGGEEVQVFFLGVGCGATGLVGCWRVSLGEGGAGAYKEGR